MESLGDAFSSMGYVGDLRGGVGVFWGGADSDLGDVVGEFRTWRSSISHLICNSITTDL